MKHSTTESPHSQKIPVRNRTVETTLSEHEEFTERLGSLANIHLAKERHAVAKTPRLISEALNDIRSATKEFVRSNLRPMASIGFKAEIVAPASLQKIQTLAFNAIEALDSVAEKVSPATPANLNTKALATEGVFLLTSFLSHILGERCESTVDEVHRFEMVRVVAGLYRELQNLSIRAEALGAGIAVQ